MSPAVVLLRIMLENVDLHDTILDVVNRAPEWLRADLLSKEQTARTAAQEAIATMIANAIKGRSAA